MGGGDFYDVAQQIAIPQVHIHTEQPAQVKESNLPVEIIGGVCVTIIAATILALVKGKK